MLASIPERYFSFDGRLARLPFFIRGLYLGIVWCLPLVISIFLFASGSRVLWWLGLVVLVLTTAALAASTVSLTVRRLHDLGLSGYHAIWVFGADLAGSALSYGPTYAAWLSLPLIAVSLWLYFWPGNRGDNRFGVA